MLLNVKTHVKVHLLFFFVHNFQSDLISGCSLHIQFSIVKTYLYATLYRLQHKPFRFSYDPHDIFFNWCKYLPINPEPWCLGETGSVGFSGMIWITRLESDQSGQTVALCMDVKSNKSDLRSASADTRRHWVVNKGRANLPTLARDCRTGTCCSAPIGRSTRPLQLAPPLDRWHWLTAELLVRPLTPFAAAPASCQLWGGKFSVVFMRRVYCSVVDFHWSFSSLRFD